jgi:hypothetical protein
MSAKANKLALELGDRLKKRLPSTFVFTEAFDTNGDATLSITADSTPATTEQNIFIRVKAIAWALTKNVLGLDQEVFTPSVVQLAIEAGDDATDQFLADTTLLYVLGEVMTLGTRVELWKETNGTVPAVTTFNTANKQKAVYEASLYFPMQAAQ